MGTRTVLDHEKLTVYQASLTFIGWTMEIMDKIPPKLAVHSQLDRASTSIPLNIAEGNGKFTPPDRCWFFGIARGSALECAACLDVLVAKRRLEPSEIAGGKEMVVGIVSMLFGLIRANSSARVFEEPPPYGVGE